MKKAPEPVSRPISAANASLVSGPLAMMVIGLRERRALLPPQLDWRLGSDGSGDFLGKTTRSTVRACPPGTRDLRRAQGNESRRRSSSLRSQGRRLLVGFERVAADQFGQTIGLVRSVWRVGAFP
jgi:hypothetical protein